MVRPPHSIVLLLLSYWLPTSDKVAVMIQIEQYAQLTEDYQLLDKPFGPKIAAIRYTVC